MARRRATSREVAEAAGVSRTTVSFVLNNVPGVRISEETRQRVLEAARRLNYHPDAAARRLVSGRTHIIGLVLRQTPQQMAADAFLPEALHGLSQAARRHGFHVMLEALDPNDTTRHYSTLVRENHADGLVLSGPRSDDAELIQLYREGFPIVLQGQLPGSNVPWVDVDNTAAARAAVEYLIGLGHRRIGLITNAPLVYTAAAARLAGYRAALEAAGLPYDEALVRCGNFTADSGYTAMVHLLSIRERPTAVFVASDLVALGAMAGARSLGLNIPRDLAVVGFDDIPLARYMEPPLTTIRLPAFALGFAAGDLLIRLLKGEEIRSPHVLLETELVVRRSCGAAD
ncbi:MAG: LacI family transcriptional regulator [Chloroflexota bacterium]